MEDHDVRPPEFGPFTPLIDIFLLSLISIFSSPLLSYFTVTIGLHLCTIPENPWLTNSQRRYSEILEYHNVDTQAQKEEAENGS